MNLIESAKAEKERLTKEYNDRLAILDGVIAGRTLTLDRMPVPSTGPCLWIWELFRYSLAPEPRWRMWTLQEAFEKVVCHKRNRSCLVAIMGIQRIKEDDCVLLAGDWVTLEYVHDNFMQPNGAPCGVREEE